MSLEQTGNRATQTRILGDAPSRRRRTSNCITPLKFIAMPAISIFEEKQVRRVWNAVEKKWMFAIVDVIAILTGSVDPAAYWRKFKERLKKEGNETVTNSHGLKMTAADGMQRMTDVADTEQLLRLIQSVPFPKAKSASNASKKSKIQNSPPSAPAIFTSKKLLRGLDRKTPARHRRPRRTHRRVEQARRQRRQGIRHPHCIT